MNGTTPRPTPDGDTFNILFGILALMMIAAIMAGVVMCIIRANRDNDDDDDEEMKEIVDDRSQTSYGMTS